MLFSKLSEVSPSSDVLAAYPQTVRDAIAYLKTTDLGALPLGKTIVDGENLYVNVDEYQTRAAETVVIESHRKYVDIQLMLVGEEWMGFRTLEPGLPVLGEGYDPDRDVVFYPKSVMPFWAPNAESPNRFVVRAGEFAIFAPEDIHASQIFVTQPAAVRKLVAKCRVTPVR